MLLYVRFQGVYSSAWKDDEGGSKGGEEGKYEKKY